MIDENCPVEVAAETLLFRLGADSRSYTMEGRVAASYDMVNPAIRTYPYKWLSLVSFTDFFAGDIDISVTVPHCLATYILGCDKQSHSRPSRTTRNQGELDLCRYLDTVTDQPFGTKFFGA